MISQADALVLLVLSALAFFVFVALILIDLLRFFGVDRVEFLSEPFGKFTHVDRRAREEMRLAIRRGQNVIDAVADQRLLAPLQRVLDNARRLLEEAERDNTSAIGGGFIFFGGPDKPAVQRLPNFADIRAFAREWNDLSLRVFALGVFSLFLRR